MDKDSGGKMESESPSKSTRGYTALFCLISRGVGQLDDLLSERKTVDIVTIRPIASFWSAETSVRTVYTPSSHL